MIVDFIETGLDVSRDEFAEPEGATDPTRIGLDGNIVGTLGYLLFGVTGVIFLLIERENAFVRFHATQSLTATALAFVVVVEIAVLGIFGSVMQIQLLPAIILAVSLGLGVVILWIFLLVQTYRGQTPQIPVVTAVTDRFI